MNIFLIFLSFILVAFGQPAWIKEFGLLAAAFGYALFWRAMLSFPLPRTRFFLAMGWFACVQGVQLSWMATLDYMGPLILLFYLLLIVGLGVQFGFLSFLIQTPLSWLRMGAIAGCWAIFEWMRLFLLCGFTWNPIGLALTGSLYSLQFASIWGIFGLSFWVIWVNLIALHAFCEKKGKQAVLWAVFALVPYLYGIGQCAWVERYALPKGSLKTALVQTALFPEQKNFLREYSASYMHPLDQLERIFAVLPKGENFDLLLFPEAALPSGVQQTIYPFAKVKDYFQESDLPPLVWPYATYDKGWKVNNAFIMQALANHFQAHVIVGLEDIDIDKKYNAAFHFSPNNLPYERYEKRVLVPMGEYVPFQKWRRFAQFVAEQFGIYASFDCGKEVKIFQAIFPIGISICLEETFSGLTRELRQKGAELFVNLTNDVWFPRSKLPQQHFDHGRVRAVENGVCLLRVCNTGVTGGVDLLGQPCQLLPISEDKAAVLTLTLPIRSYRTLYTFWGDGAILAMSLFGVAFHFYKVRKSCRK